LAVSFSLILHLVAIYFLFNKWDEGVKIQKISPPKYLQAKLISMDEKIKKKIQPKPKPKSKPKPKPKPKKNNEKKIKQKITDKQQMKSLQVSKQLELENKNKKIVSSYSAYITERIEANWNRPPSARRGMEAKLLITLVPTGQVISVKLLKKSGNIAFDRSAEQAVYKVGSFDKLQQLDIRTFEKSFRKFQLVFKPNDLRL
jgi:colicin import membrane protein